MKLSQLFVGCAVIYLSWLGMQAIHELGHVLAAQATGGTVVRVVLHPVAISRTDVSPNPWPLVVAWGGPLLGVMGPLAFVVASRFVAIKRFDWRSYADFFAGFCLIANGAYIGLGSFERIGDAGDLLRHGSPHWLLMAFGLSAIAGGLSIWHLALKRHRMHPRDNDPSERDPQRSISGAPLRQIADLRLHGNSLPPLRTPRSKPRKSLPNQPKKRPSNRFSACLEPSSYVPRQLSCDVPTCLHEAELRYPKPGGDRSRYR